MKALSALVAAMFFVMCPVGSHHVMGQEKQDGIKLLDEAKSLQAKARTKGDLQKALEKYEQALGLYKKIGDRKEEAYIYNVMGIVYDNWGQYPKALENYEKSLAICTAIDDKAGEGIALNNIGEVHRKRGEHGKALEYYEKSLAIKRAMGDKSAEGPTLNNIGLVHDNLGEYGKALQYYEKSLAIHKAVGDKSGEGTTLGNIGAVHDNRGEYGEALEYYGRSLAISRQIGDKSGEGTMLDNMGVVYNKLGEHRKALEHHDKSLAMRRAIGDKSGEGVTLSNIGIVYDNLAEYRKALEYYEKSLVIKRQIGDKSGEGTTLNNIGAVHDNLGEYRQALEYYERSLGICKTIGNKSQEGQTLGNMGVVFDNLGEYGKAIEYYEKSLEIRRQIGDKSGEGTTLGNIGEVHRKLGQYGKALEYYEKSLGIKRQIGDKSGEGTTLGNIGLAYNNLGEYGKALEYYEKSLAIRLQIGDKSGEAVTLSNMASVFMSFGRYPRALDHYEKSLGIRREIGDKPGESVSLNNLGYFYDAVGDRNKALAFYEQSLAIKRKIGDTQGEAVALGNIAALQRDLGEYSRALENYQEALTINKKIGVPHAGTLDSIACAYLEMGDIGRAEALIRETKFSVSLGLLALAKSDHGAALKHFSKRLEAAEKNRDTKALFAAHTGLGLSYEGTKQYEEAVTHFRKAIEVSEAIRESLNDSQRVNFYDAKIWTIPRIAPYEGLARVLLKKGDSGQSFRQAEWTRARSFSEALSRRSAGFSLDVPAAKAEADRQINDRLAVLVRALETAYQKGSSKEAIESITKELDAVRKERDTHVATLRKEYPLFAATKYPEPMALDQTALRNSEWTLAYEVTDRGVCVYLVHGKAIVKTLFKETSRKDLDQLVRNFREPLEAVAESSEFAKMLASFDFKAGKRLSDLLLGDVLPLLPKGVPIGVVPDDSLSVVPFEMLVLNEGGQVLTGKTVPCTSGTEFFGDRNPISYYQSITALTLARTLGKQQRTGVKTLAMVDPVFSADDSRLAKMAMQEKENLLASLPKDILMSIQSQNGLTFPRLPLTANLGYSLKKTDPQRTDLYEGMEAKKPAILAKDLTAYNSLVFATHGYFGKDLPGIQEPVLVLTLLDQPKDQDGFLRMSEVMGLKLNSEVVALTACQSGLGRHISGEGTMGMGRAFQYAGARSVLMSLWSVAEASSVQLVESFFRHLKEGKSKLEALSLARTEIRQAGYDHPFFWAPFILVGEVE